MPSKKAVEVVVDVPQRAMAIGAHPDDVEIFAGGTLAKWIDLGCIVTSVICTDGGAGSAQHDLASSAVAVRRREEQEAAANVLGVSRLIMLGYPDGGLEDSDEFRGALVELLREHRPEVVLSHDPHARHHFIHRDHRKAGQVALDAIYPYARDPLHFPHQITGGLAVHRVDRCLLWDTDEPNAVVDVSATLETKARALEQHASQLGGILGEADPVEWLRERSREAASGLGLRDGESFRMLRAPK